MTSERRVAHVGLVSACLVLFTTLTIVYQGASGPVVGQHESRHPAAAARDAGRQFAAHPLKLAAQK